MLVLGIDPGTINAGFGIISFKDNSPTYIDSGIIKPGVAEELPERLQIIYDNIADIIQRYKPDQFAIETAFYGKNVKSALMIGYARGVSLLAAQHGGLAIKEYSPREIKKSITGKGAATKEQVMYMVAGMLKLNTEGMKFDETDALGVALCHCYRYNSKTAKSKSWKEYITQNPDKVIK